MCNKDARHSLYSVFAIHICVKEVNKGTVTFISLGFTCSTCYKRISVRGKESANRSEPVIQLITYQRVEKKAKQSTDRLFILFPSFTSLSLSLSCSLFLSLTGSKQQGMKKSGSQTCDLASITQYNLVAGEVQHKKKELEK